jgi:hypothetical protein
MQNNKTNSLKIHKIDILFSEASLAMYQLIKDLESVSQQMIENGKATMFFSFVDKFLYLINAIFYFYL